MITLNAVPSFSANGYGSSVVRTARDAEYDIFSRVTGMLRQADASGQGPDRIAAVDKNNQLWTILASDLADPGNALPDHVRAGLLSLAGFALRHGHQALSGKVALAPLIDINMAIMRGLRQEAQA